MIIKTKLRITFCPIIPRTNTKQHAKCVLFSQSCVLTNSGSLYSVSVLRLIGPRQKIHVYKSFGEVLDRRECPVERDAIGGLPWKAAQVRCRARTLSTKPFSKRLCGCLRGRMIPATVATPPTSRGVNDARPYFCPLLPLLAKECKSRA